MINKRVSAATERSFAIDGRLNVDWIRQSDPGITGWRRYFPLPYITAENIRLSNPAGIDSRPQMIQLQRAEILLNPLGLLHHTVDLPRVTLIQPDINIERLANGKNNWTFPSSNAPSVWKMAPRSLAIVNGKLTLNDRIQKLQVQASVSSLPRMTSEGYGLQWQAEGKFHDAPLTSQGRAGGVLSVEDLEQAYPLQAELKVGETAIFAKGTLQSPLDLKRVDMQLALSGPSMSTLYPLTGVLLPVTSAFATQGHLQGMLDQQGSRWDYQQFTGRVGGSDLNGSLSYLAGAPRPKLQGELFSNRLAFDDLAPLIGGDSNQQKKARGEATRQPNDKILPHEPFDTAKWGTLDADVKYRAKTIIKTADLPLTDLQTHLTLINRNLSLHPLNFGFAGGTLRANIRLDGSRKPIESDLDVGVEHVQIRKLFPNLESIRASFGEINGKIRLNGQGNSVADMLATSNGASKIMVTSGAVSKFILEAAGLNVVNAVASKLFGDRQVQLNCLASDLAIHNGLVRTNRFALDTDDAVISITGDVNLATEIMDLDVKPQSKGVRIVSLRSPLFINGTFAHPDVGINKTVIAAKAGAAALLGVVAAPVAAIVPLINPGRTEPVDCTAALKEVKQPLPSPAALHQQRKDDIRTRER